MITSFLNSILTWVSNPQTGVANINSVASICVSLIVIIGVVCKATNWAWQLFRVNLIYKKLKPYYQKNEIKRATKYYIQTKCQNIDPAVMDEPEHSHSSVVDAPYINFFINNVFKEKETSKHYIILADSGMGKTTFMINLYFKYSRKWFKKFPIKLFPLGYSNQITDRINEIKDKPNTILMLDALDEDPLAHENPEKRIAELIKITQDFQTIIITCRSQFFHADDLIPKKTGINKQGVDKGDYRFKRIYISPFKDKDIKQFLTKKFHIHLNTKRRASKIINQSKKLMARPMLLANIEDLLAKKTTYKYSYKIYEALVDSWIQRERVENKQALHDFSEKVALHILNNKNKSSLYLTTDEIEKIAAENEIPLKKMDMTGRSLLNRGSTGLYKFAHKSIFEYFVALIYLKADPLNCHTIDFKGLDQAKTFSDEMVFDQIIIPFINQRKNCIFLGVKKSNLRSSKDIDFFVTEIITKVSLKLKNLRELNHLEIQFLYKGVRLFKNLKELSIPNCKISVLPILSELKELLKLDLSRTTIEDFSHLSELKNLEILGLSETKVNDLSFLSELKMISIDLNGADLTGIDKTVKSLKEADLRGADLTGANMTAADMSGAKLGGAKLIKANLTNTNLMNANLRDANLTNADLTGANLICANLIESNLTGANLMRINGLTDDIIAVSQMASNSLLGMEMDKLTGANLTGANLTRADMREANLRESCMRESCMRDVNLAGADLTGANLKGVNLKGANLKGTDLTRANLKEANLAGANLKGTKLVRADLSRAILTIPGQSTSGWPENPRQVIGEKTGANLFEANITGIKLIEATWMKPA